MARRPASPLAVVFPLLVAASVALLVLRGLERAGVRRWVRAPGRVAALAGRPAGADHRRRDRGGHPVPGRRPRGAGLRPGGAPRRHRGRRRQGRRPGRRPDGRRVGRRAGRASEPPAAQAVSPVAGRHRGLPRPGPTAAAFGNQAVLAVDSRTFAAAADWGASGVLSRGRGAARGPAGQPGDAPGAAGRRHRPPGRRPRHAELLRRVVGAVRRRRRWCPRSPARRRPTGPAR